MKAKQITLTEMEETIELIVKVKINYRDKSRRKEAIKEAKRCALSCSVLGSTGCEAKSAKLFTGARKAKRVAA